MTTPRWTHRPEGSNWGEFGPDDEAGRLNLIGREQVLRGVAEVREGRSFCLSLPLTLPGGNVLNPRRHPPRLFATERGGTANYNFPMSREQANFTDVISDDAVLLHTQYSTQWDALSHVGARFDADGDGAAERVYYNGWRADDHVVAPPDTAAPPYEGPCAERLGIAGMAERCVQGRAVLVDLHAHYGDDRTLIGYDELMRVMAADGVEVETGDMVCLHTGFARILRAMGGRPDAERLHRAAPALNGRDPELQAWIRDSGLAILAADNYAVEAYPAVDGRGDCAALPLHELCLFKLGIHLGELWWLSDLAAHLRAAGRSRFLLTAPPLNLPGAVGSPATPVATV
jgi:hypothetical protein